MAIAEIIASIRQKLLLMFGLACMLWMPHGYSSLSTRWATIPMNWDRNRNQCPKIWNSWWILVQQCHFIRDSLRKWCKIALWKFPIWNTNWGYVFQPFQRFVETGRVAKCTSGPLRGKLITIVDCIDQTRVSGLSNYWFLSGGTSVNNARHANDDPTNYRNCRLKPKWS